MIIPLLEPNDTNMQMFEESNWQRGRPVNYLQEQPGSRTGDYLE